MGKYDPLWKYIQENGGDTPKLTFDQIQDILNIEARAVTLHREELADYKITPKGMLQIYLKQDIPTETLKRIFAETLG